jgi:hypothetical protein
VPCDAGQRGEQRDMVRCQRGAAGGQSNTGQAGGVGVGEPDSMHVERAFNDKMFEDEAGSNLAK